MYFEPGVTDANTTEIFGVKRDATYVKDPEGCFLEVRRLPHRPFDFEVWELVEYARRMQAIMRFSSDVRYALLGSDQWFTDHNSSLALEASVSHEPSTEASRAFLGYRGYLPLAHGSMFGVRARGAGNVRPLLKDDPDPRGFTVMRERPSFEANELRRDKGGYSNDGGSGAYGSVVDPRLSGALTEYVNERRRTREE